MSSRTCVGTTDVPLPVKKNTNRMNHLVAEMFLPGWRSCDGGSQTRLMTTDVSPPVKNNTDRMNQLFGLMFLLGWKSV